MFEGFRKFILRGNVVDLAIGVLIGAAFNTLVQSLTKDILTPLIAAGSANTDFSQLSFTIRGSQVLYGDFLNAALSFLIVAATAYFFVVLPMNKLMDCFRKPHSSASMKKQCSECLSDIPEGAKRCPYCTSQLTS